VLNDKDFAITIVFSTKPFFSPIRNKSLYRYFDILERADEIIYLSNHYYTGCMQKRNAYMVDRCDVLVCYLKKEKGGTAGTVSYCKRKYPEKEIIFI
jgi:uncharacterized phage-like protein YoqJ